MHINLCLLSAVNKPVMLKCGLIDAVLPHIKVDLAAVQFKLLGTLRMIIDGQGGLIGQFTSVHTLPYRFRHDSYHVGSVLATWPVSFVVLHNKVKFVVSAHAKQISSHGYLAEIVVFVSLCTYFLFVSLHTKS